MKLFALCLLLFVASGTRAQLVATGVTIVTEAFVQLIKTQNLIKTVESRNREVLTPSLRDITRELNQDVSSEIFKIGMGIHDTLVDVNIKIGQISGNATAIISQINFAARSGSSILFENSVLDYNMKKHLVAKLVNDTLDMTNLVLNLIDETKEKIGKGVGGPLKVLQLTVQLNSDDKIQQEKARIEIQKRTIRNPPKWLLFFTDYNAVKAAQDLKFVSENTIERIETLVATILQHIDWLEKVCLTIREQLDIERTKISDIKGRVKGAEGTLGALDIYFKDPQGMSDPELRQGSKALVDILTQLRDQVNKISKSNRSRRDTQVALTSWLNKTPEHGCVYTAAGSCVSAYTYNKMKTQYQWLTEKYSHLQTAVNNQIMNLKKIETPVVSVSRDLTYRTAVIKDIGDVETLKLLWSDEVKKIRDLLVTLNAYGDSIFSNTAQIPHKDDNELNGAILQFLDENRTDIMDALYNNINNILILNEKLADMLERLPAAPPVTPKPTVRPRPGGNWRGYDQAQAV